MCERQTDRQTENTIHRAAWSQLKMKEIGKVVQKLTREQDFGGGGSVWTGTNKANLRDLIAATGLVILLKLDLNRWFFSPCDLDIWWMTPQNNRAPLLCYFKLFASFRSHWWIQTGVTVRKRLIWVKINAFFSRVTLKFDGWPSKTIGHLFYVISSFVQHFVATDEFKLELQSGNT